MHIIGWQSYFKASEQTENGMSSWAALVLVKEQSSTMNRGHLCYNPFLTEEKHNTQAMSFRSVISDLQIHYETMQSFKCQRLVQEGFIHMYPVIFFCFVAIKLPDILALHIHLCYKNFSHVRPVSLVAVHVIELEK